MDTHNPTATARRTPAPIASHIATAVNSARALRAMWVTGSVMPTRCIILKPTTIPKTVWAACRSFNDETSLYCRLQPLCSEERVPLAVQRRIGDRDEQPPRNDDEIEPERLGPFLVLGDALENKGDHEGCSGNANALVKNERKRTSENGLGNDKPEL
jgi:hypothetical protein